MNYTAVNTKIKAMRAKLLTVRDYEQLCHGTQNFPAPQNDVKKIIPYLQEPARDFVEKPFDSLRETINGIGKLDKSSQKSLKKIFGTEADLRNILWLYRLKRYHKIEGNAVFSYLIPANYKLSAAEITALAHIKDLEIFIRVVASGAYGEI
ncbi:MAG: V-type ATPase subunit, partial [Clostridiales bacterium]|nr:V-type ATPase subunit [Clostridiales bacterium]